jgi:hypothetical protein
VAGIGIGEVDRFVLVGAAVPAKLSVPVKDQAGRAKSHGNLAEGPLEAPVPDHSPRSAVGTPSPGFLEGDVEMVASLFVFGAKMIIVSETEGVVQERRRCHADLPFEFAKTQNSGSLASGNDFFSPGSRYRPLTSLPGSRGTAVKGGGAVAKRSKTLDGRSPRPIISVTGRYRFLPIYTIPG